MIEQVGPADRSGRRRAGFREWVVAGSIVAVVAGLLWNISRDVRGPAGDPIPKKTPDEANRHVYPNGISMVLPPNWQPYSAGVGMVPLSPGRYARRSKALIHIASLGPERPADLARLHRTTFLGREAYEGMEVIRRWSFDDGARSDFILLLQRGPDWYEIQYSVAEERTVLPDVIRQYINTIRWEEVPVPPGVPVAVKP